MSAPQVQIGTNWAHPGLCLVWALILVKPMASSFTLQFPIALECFIHFLDKVLQGFFSLAFEGTSPTLKMVMVAWTFSHLHAKSSAIQMKNPSMKTKLYLMLGIACSRGLPLIFSGLQHHWAATLKATT